MGILKKLKNNIEESPKRVFQIAIKRRLQSEERAHRIGQDEKVTYIDLIIEGTVDEKIVRSLKTKFRLSAQTLGEVVRTWL